MIPHPAGWIQGFPWWNVGPIFSVTNAGITKDCRKYCHQRPKIILNLQIGWKSCSSCCERPAGR